MAGPTTSAATGCAGSSWAAGGGWGQPRWVFPSLPPLACVLLGLLACLLVPHLSPLPQHQILVNKKVVAEARFLTVQQCRKGSSHFKGGAVRRGEGASCGNTQASLGRRPFPATDASCCCMSPPGPSPHTQAVIRVLPAPAPTGSSPLTLSHSLVIPDGMLPSCLPAFPHAIPSAQPSEFCSSLSAQFTCLLTQAAFPD